MSGKTYRKLYRPIVAVVLSAFFCGTGQIYLHKILRGLILALSFFFAITVIWMAVSRVEFNLINWRGRQIIFSPASRAISLGGQAFRVTDIMKVTGIIQLIVTWVFSVADAWAEGKKQS